MTLNSLPRQARRRIIAIAILLVGCGSALVIYATAIPVPANPLGYEPEDTKQYLREMEVYGGKANVIASAFLQWIESPWQGRRLAFTVAGLTLVLLLIFWVASTPLPPRVEPTSQRDPKTDRTEP